MINTELEELFSILHDGYVEDFVETEHLKLKFGIQYLAEKFHEGSEYLMVTLHDVKDIKFEQWGDDNETLYNFSEIFDLGIEISSAEVKGGQLIVHCNCESAFDEDPAGGMLTFNCTGYQLTTEQGIDFTLDELKEKTKQYWNDFGNAL